MKKSYLGILILILCAAAYFIGQKINRKETPNSSSAAAPSKSERRTAKPVKEKSPERRTVIKTKDDVYVNNSQLVIELIGSPENSDYTKLVYKAAELKHLKISKDDFSALCEFLKSAVPRDGNYLGIHSLKNEILVALIENGSYLDELGLVFTDIISDPEQHPVIREYVSQFIPEYFAKRWQGSDTAEEQERILQPLYKLLENREDSLAGTALSTLSILSEKYPLVDKDLLKRKAYQMTDDSALTQASRMQALRYINQFKEGRVILEEFSFNSSNPVMLRMIALRSLSEKVEAAAKERVFKRISNEILNEKGEDKRLITAARAACKILDTQVQGKE